MYTKKKNGDEIEAAKEIDRGTWCRIYSPFHFPYLTFSDMVSLKSARPSAARHPNTFSHNKSCFSKDGEATYPNIQIPGVSKNQSSFKKWSH
jgi:hypothetical protein